MKVQAIQLILILTFSHFQNIQTLCPSCADVLNKEHCSTDHPGICAWANEVCSFIECEKQTDTCMNDSFFWMEAPTECYRGKGNKCMTQTTCAKRELDTFDDTTCFDRCEPSPDGKSCQDRVMKKCADKDIALCVNDPVPPAGSQWGFPSFNEKDLSKFCYWDGNCKALDKYSGCDARESESHCLRSANQCQWKSSDKVCVANTCKDLKIDQCVPINQGYKSALKGCVWDVASTTCIDKDVSTIELKQCNGLMGMVYDSKNMKCVVCPQFQSSSTVLTLTTATALAFIMLY